MLGMGIIRVILYGNKRGIMINSANIEGSLEDDARKYVEGNGYQFCVVKRDGTGYAASQKVGVKRVNVEVREGRVNRVIEILNS